MISTHTHQRAIALLALAAICTTTVAQQEFTLAAEYRPRAELRSGYTQPLSQELSPAWLMQQRTRLLATYQSPTVRAHFTLQDARTFGQMNQKGVPVSTANQAPTLSVYEAWAELVLHPTVALRVGRQALGYDDKRLIDASSWSNTGNAHDLALLTYRKANSQAHLGYAYNNDQTNPLTNDTPYGEHNFYKNLAYLWLSHQWGTSGFKLTALAVSDGFGQETTLEDATIAYTNTYRYTYGGNVGWGKDKCPLNLYATAYAQSGKTKKGVALNAYLLALKADYRIAAPLALGGGVDYISGTSKGVDTTTKTNTFTGLYGSTHSFGGAMDYWTTATYPTGGLVDWYLKTSYVATPRITLQATFHSFALAKQMQGLSSKGLGQELDLDATYQWSDIVTLNAGWSTYLASPITNQVRGVTGVTAPTQHTDTHFKQWAYVSIKITPQLFTYKK